MIASTQITNTEIFLFITVLIFKLFYWPVKFCIQTKKTIETVKKYKITNIVGKLPQNYK